MDEKIIQFSKGNFEASGSDLILSDNSLIFQVEEGRVAKGSFYIGNNKGAVMQGILYSECPYITLARNNLNGRELSIEYTFSAEELTAGEVVDSAIHVITNCGEADIPVTVTIDIPSIDYEGVRIKDLTGFAGLVKEDSAKALQIFKSPDFKRVFLYRDVENQVLYSELLKSSQSLHAMEEFLVATRKKNRVSISVDKNNFEFDNCVGRISDRIKVSSNTWGNVEIVVRSEGSFIEVSRKRLWTDQFEDEYTYLEFDIDASKMKTGINEGKIYLETMHQKVEVCISCSPAEGSVNESYLNKQYELGIMRTFVELRSGDITPYEFRERIDSLNVQYRENNGKISRYSDLSMAFATIVCNRDDVKEYIDELAPRDVPGPDAEDREVIEYALYLYVLAMSCSVLGDFERAQDYVSELRNMYDAGYDHWLVFNLLCNLDAGMSGVHKTFVILSDYIKKGCTSPVVYAQFCDALTEDSSLIHDWNDTMIRPIAWGARRGYISLEVAVRYAYQVSRLKDYNKMAFHSLEHLYNRYNNDEILAAICRMLIKGGIADIGSHKWYKLGVDRQFKITQLNEYYIISLKDDNDEIIPHNVLMYFAYDNRLPDNEKAKLFAAVIRGKKTDEVAYKAYSVMMANFARRMLEKGSITSNLAVVYEDCIKMDSIDESVGLALPKVMFRKEVICNNPLVTHVCVVHKETNDEQIVPFVSGKAYVDIFSEEAYIFMVDKIGNRYYQSEDYTLRKLLHLDAYADKCFMYSTDDRGLLTHMFIKCIKDYRTTEENIAVRRYAQRRLNLSTHYVKNNLAALIYYYYEHADGERLDEMLEHVSLSENEKSTRGRWIELYIIRGMYLRALYSISCYGYDDVSYDRLGKLCEELIAYDEDELVWEDNKLSEILTEVVYAVFAKGGYTKGIIEYLAEHYNGASSNLISIWKAASGIGVDTAAFEERILDRLLLVENNIIEGLPVLHEALKRGREEGITDETCRKAYITYLCYIYITGDSLTADRLGDDIWQYIDSNIMVEYNTICLLAVLKRYSEAETITEEQRTFCEVRLAQLYKNGVIMSFYKNFDINSDREIIQCVARPGISMCMKCTNSDGGVEIIKVPEVCYGVYAVELVVFAGETLVYEFYEETGNSKVVHGSGRVVYSKSSSNDSGRLRMINDMIELLDEENYTELLDKMERYIEIDLTYKDLMEIL